MHITPLPYIPRDDEEQRVRAFLSDRLQNASGGPIALVLSGAPGSGRRTLLRHVFRSEPAFSAFRCGAQTRAIVQAPAEGRLRAVAEKAAELAPSVLGMANPLLELAAEAALLVRGQPQRDMRTPDRDLDYTILERIKDPVLLVVPGLDATDVEALEDAARLVREAAVRATPLTVVFLEDAPPSAPGSEAPDADGHPGSRLASGLRRFLDDDRTVDELRVLPLEEKRVRRVFTARRLAPAWAATSYHLTDGHPGALAAWWLTLQEVGILRHEGEDRWQADSPTAAAQSWGLVRNLLISQVRARLGSERIHEDRLLTALHLAAAMGDTFLPTAVSDAVHATSPKRDGIDADAWEDLWFEVLEFEDADHPAIASPVMMDGKPVEAQGDDRRFFVYQFRDPAITHLIRASLRKLWRRNDGALRRDGLERPAGEVESWINNKFQKSWRTALPYRAAMLEVQNRRMEARGLYELHYNHTLATSLTNRIEKQSAKYGEKENAGELYHVLYWAAHVHAEIGNVHRAIEYSREAYRLWREERVNLSPLQKISLFAQLGRHLSAEGRERDAEPLFLSALRDSDRLLGEEHPTTLAVVNHMGVLLESMGRWGEAEPYFRRALEVSERVLGADHPHTLTAVSSMGMLLSSMGKLGKAELYCRRALEVREHVLGPEHPDTITSVHNMGSLLVSMGRPGEAEPYYRRALKLREQGLGPEHTDTLKSVNGLGSLLNSMGKPGEAEPYFRRALEVSERVLGAEHPSTLGSVNNLGAVLNSMGKSEEAEPYVRRALEVSERMLGAEHPHTLYLVNTMGFLLNSMEKSQEAESYFRRALEVGERVFGVEHPNTLASVSNVGWLLDSTGRSQEAEPYVRRALEVRERVLGVEHPDTLTSINNMGVMLYSIGKPEEAELYLRRALETRERTLGAEHPQTLDSVENMASLLDAMGRSEEAKAFHRRVVIAR